MSGGDFQSRYASVMDSMLQSAVAETTKLFETMVEELKAEISRIKKENDDLKSKCSNFENVKNNLQVDHVNKEKETSDRAASSDKRDIGIQCGKLVLQFVISPAVHGQDLSGEEDDNGMEDETNPNMAFILIKQEDPDCDDYAPGYILLKQEDGEPTLVPRHPFREIPALNSGALRALVSGTGTITPAGAAPVIQRVPEAQRRTRSPARTTEPRPGIGTQSSGPGPNPAVVLAPQREELTAVAHEPQADATSPEKDMPPGVPLPAEGCNPTVIAPSSTGTAGETGTPLRKPPVTCQPPESAPSTSEHPAPLVTALRKDPPATVTPSGADPTPVPNEKEKPAVVPEPLLVSQENETVHPPAVVTLATSVSGQEQSVDSVGPSRSPQSPGGPEADAEKTGAQPSRRTPSDRTSFPTLQEAMLLVDAINSQSGAYEAMPGLAIHLSPSSTTRSGSRSSPRGLTYISVGPGSNSPSTGSPHSALQQRNQTPQKPPIVSPLQPLSVIGQRLLKNQCGECGRVLSSPAALESHVQLHRGRRPFSCLLCGKNFPDNKGLTRHGRVHRNGRIHVCAQCGKGFVYRFGLTKHLQMVHGKVKPFVCQLCGKGFFTRRDVEAHIRVHTGEKPFHCHICPKRFKRRVELNVHIRWHNGEKRHWCPFCEKGFLDYNNLKRHKYIHTGERPHSCPQCTKTFTQSGHLKKHLKNVHKVK
ncbi:uncharacterized protein FYW47_003946 [Aplochiton taeniatus]